MSAEGILFKSSSQANAKCPAKRLWPVRSSESAGVSDKREGDARPFGLWSMEPGGPQIEKSALGGQTSQAVADCQFQKRLAISAFQLQRGLLLLLPCSFLRDFR